MNFEIITLFPEMFCALKSGVIGRAIEKEVIQLNYWNPRDYAKPPHHRVDDRPFGGGPGMVMQYEPVAGAIKHMRDHLTTPQPKLIYLSPQGKPLDQARIEALAKEKNLALLCGRYEGIDERIIEDYVDEEISIGDYVLSGGELPAMTLIDAISRWIPGVLGHEESASIDSHQNNLLDHPHYTRPATISGKSVPDVLLSGDHQAIERWRKKMSLGKTWQKRQDLLKRCVLSEEELALLAEFKTNLQID